MKSNSKILKNHNNIKVTNLNHYKEGHFIEYLHYKYANVHTETGTGRQNEIDFISQIHKMVEFFLYIFLHNKLFF